ncbi:GlxA family transcriptional regulator [Leisingera sp. M527]|uniref:GlxA family transcriptional regulator n=1 Tax=unclassified Leisingera TaxID=2614906 RepID=UPI001010727F|nr:MULTISPECIES: GlxA family transcriptional regulator [unclassified Leisingera]MCF6432814.1 GlxA family transcriptional regulator [Leisingera sp. MMG026]QAX29390.1 GlxA family transcriptional regulator [Leisingera sp. NJS204]UWQ31109.1 GlxA family transcriptional regulator [Leisingera sp. M527]UWQ73143.1 GlxA family transcriptional regulator [Leisingera sp. M658]
MADDSFVQKGAAANLAVPFEGEPQDFYFLLLPKATMLPVAAAIEPLRIANQVTGTRLYRWYIMTEDGQPLHCSNGMVITPDTPLQPLPSDSLGFVCAGVEPQNTASEITLNWLRRESRFGRSIGGICTGAFALAQAGLIKNHKFTLHWENQPGFLESYPNLDPSPNIFEISGPLMTCGGGNAATDMMLHLIEERHGKQLAIIVADMCLHVRSGGQAAPQKSNYAVAIGSRNQRLLNALQLMQESIEEPLSIGELCDRLDISRRQLERLFSRYLNQSPMHVYFDMRLSHAFALMNETSMSVTEIALASGFNSATHFSRQFKRKFGASPHFFRKGWS